MIRFMAVTEMTSSMVELAVTLSMEGPATIRFMAVTEMTSSMVETAMIGLSTPKAITNSGTMVITGLTPGKVDLLPTSISLLESRTADQTLLLTLLVMITSTSDPNLVARTGLP